VELSAQLPLELKFRDGRGKWILRQVLHRYVPQPLVDRPKQGFEVPIGARLRGELREWAGDLLRAGRLTSDGFLDPVPVQRAWEQHQREEGGPLGVPLDCSDVPSVAGRGHCHRRHGAGTRMTVTRTARGRVVLFAPGLHEVGGAARRSRLFAEGLVERGWEIRVVTRSATDRRPTVRRSPGILTVELPGFGRRRLGAMLYLLVAVPLGAVWCRRARGVLAVQLSSPAVAASLAALPWRTPLLAFSSTTGELSEVTAVQGSRLAPIRRWLLRRARFLVTQTDVAAAELHRLVPQNRVAVVPTPVRSVDAPPLTGAPRAMYMGRFSAEKDLLRLVEAWRSVLSVIPGATLTLLGALTMAETVRRYVAVYEEVADAA
jgi:hypothetical protein